MRRMSCGRSIRVLAFLFPAIVGGCSAPRALRMTTEVAPVAQAKIRNDISASLDRQVKAWNDGDVDGFMRGYWRDAKLTFLSGGTATFGSGEPNETVLLSAGGKADVFLARYNPDGSFHSATRAGGAG